MKAFFASVLFIVSVSAQAQKAVPSGVECMKEGKRLGLSVVDAYQACSLKPATRSCIFKQLNENRALESDKKELAKLGKAAVKECQE